MSIFYVVVVTKTEFECRIMKNMLTNIELLSTKTVGK